MARREAAQRDLFRGDKFTRDQLRRAAEYYAKSNKTIYDAAREAIFRLTTTSKSARQGTEKTRAGVNRALSRVLQEDAESEARERLEEIEFQSPISGGTVVRQVGTIEEAQEMCDEILRWVHSGDFDSREAADRDFDKRKADANVLLVVMSYLPKGVYYQIRHRTKKDKAHTEKSRPVKLVKEVFRARPIYAVDYLLCLGS